MWWIAVWCLAALAAFASSTPLSISLETSWAAPPLILEILETIYDEEPASYLPFLRSFGKIVELDEWPEHVLNKSLEIIESEGLLSRPSALSTFKYALGLHTAVPRIEAFYSWYAENIKEENYGIENCESWVEWNGKAYCDEATLLAQVQEDAETGTQISEIPALPFDHISESSHSTQAAYYYDPSGIFYTPMLSFLIDKQKNDPHFGFVVRYRPLRSSGSGKRTPMSGYGVEMVLKKTDYLVVDDRATGQTQTEKTIMGSEKAVAENNMFSDVLGPDPWSETSVPLARSEIAEIGLQAASLIMSSPNKLDALEDLSQNFPKYSAAIARKVNTSQAIDEKVPAMLKAGAPTPGIYINGKLFSDPELNAFSLLKSIRKERDLILSLTELGLSTDQAFQLISDPIIGEQQTSEDPTEGIVDASDRIEEGGVITWWNDIEKDKRYKSWNNLIAGYLRPLYPGQLHTVRRNTWNLVMVLDLSMVPSLEVIVEQMSAMIKGGVPIRFGIVPMLDKDEDDISVQAARVFEYSVKTFGRGSTRDILEKLITMTPSSVISPGKITLDKLKFAYEVIAEESTKSPKSFDDVIGKSETPYIDSVRHYTSRLMATKEESASGHLFLNGKYFTMSGQWMAFVQSELTQQVQFLQEQLALGNVLGDKITTFFYDLPSALTRRSKLVAPDLIENKLRINNLLEVFSGSGMDKLKGDFLYPPGDENVASTLWIIGDLDSPQSKQVILDAISQMTSDGPKYRIGFVHVAQGSRVDSTGISTRLYEIIHGSGLQSTEPLELAASLAMPDEASPDTSAAAEKFWKLGHVVAQRLGMKSTAPHVLINGRLVGPVTAENFVPEDFDLLVTFEHRKRVKPMMDLLSTMNDDMEALDRSAFCTLVTTASSILASAYSPDDNGIFTPLILSRTRAYEKIDDGPLSFSLGSEKDAILHVAAVVDPISEQAQRWSSILKTLAEMERISIKVYLTPTPFTTEIKLKRFYRYCLSSHLELDNVSDDIAPPLVFNDLPEAPIFTLGIDAPPSWIISPKHSLYDLDNLVIGSMQDSANVVFELKQILIEGHARESNNAPPRGLQLQLKTKNGEVASDTQVMANLGYFQFKASPGMYNLAIRPGRGTDVYDLESVGNEGWDSANVTATGTRVALTSFDGKTILPRFVRKEGMESASVLADETALQHSYPQAVFSRMKQMIGLSPKETAVAKSKHADINIFTVASGLLYERFASIMVLSVMKNTQSSVKFWFIENFLSPEFLDFIPKMAEEYGFQYEFVTYKWPHWLRAQTEKQRIIWAYKILFLDVLFPMDLDKVIFVDADQIVRTDMKELVDLDLQGHVYGYPPMGNDREEMEGFRFWKTGYWKDALRGRPYHISALYVVDLKRFRQLATGDRLRGQYHALSADPNSLANLDQDLPNSMQDQIPIFTLDQDWLWCQTWCSDESLATAKTIDLCQNPLTKEPKLVRARQIPEWDTYDQEIARFAARVSGGAGLASSVDALAAGPATPNDVDTSDAIDTGDIDGATNEPREDESEESGRRIDDEL